MNLPGAGLATAATELSPESFEKLARLITRQTGIQLPARKASMVQGRLQRRVRALGLPSVEAYCEQVLAPGPSEEELVLLIDAVTTNKTDFFREKAHFERLTRMILPEWQARARPGDRLRLWSAACSSGEEPYTLAMVLTEYAASHSPLPFRILATDVSTRVLERARTGTYARARVSDVPPALRPKYLQQGRGEHADLVRMVPALRRSVSFHRLNLMDRDYRIRERFDLVFCRNVFIYFDRPTQAAVTERLCRHLLPGGYLFLGHSESLVARHLPLASLGGSCYRKIANG